MPLLLAPPLFAKHSNYSCKHNSSSSVYIYKPAGKSRAEFVMLCTGLIYTIHTARRNFAPLFSPLPAISMCNLYIKFTFGDYRMTASAGRAGTTWVISLSSCCLLLVLHNVLAYLVLLYTLERKENAMLKSYLALKSYFWWLMEVPLSRGVF